MCLERHGLHMLSRTPARSVPTAAVLPAACARSGWEELVWGWGLGKFPSAAVSS